MTTETKHETPLFSCCDDICRIERSLPAYMLAMSEKGPVCEECYDNWEVDRDWHDLPRFIPASDARIAELEAALKNVLKCFSAEGYHLAPVQGGNDNQFQDVKSARAALGERHD